MTEGSSPEVARAAPRRGQTRRWLLLALVGFVALAAWLWRARPPSVATVELQQREMVSTLAVIGRVRAPSESRLGASIAGTAIDVRVREGDRVAAGQVLVVLDQREPAALVRQSEAALAVAQAGWKSRVDEAEREAAQAQRDLERIRSVFQDGGLTQQRVDQAEQRAADARGRLEALRAAAPHGDREPAEVASARAALDAARARLALTRVTAPAAGTILSRSVEPGDAVAPGQVLLQLALDGPSEIVVFPAEENLAGLRVGARATVSADAFPDSAFDAAVSLVAPAIDPAQGTVEVRLAVPHPPRYLMPDLTVSVNIELARNPAASVLPEDAVQGLGGGEPWVGVVRDGRLERRSVRVGLRADGWVEVLSGIEPGERVALGAAELEPGSRVRASEREVG